ncbi:MAG TPA: hypothetical protein VMF35_18390 [Acidimicrobiales bacterium]|nr:hypothetical protein [Acidimicrobiales bacterium]
MGDRRARDRRRDARQDLDREQRLGPAELARQRATLSAGLDQLARRGGTASTRRTIADHERGQDARGRRRRRAPDETLSLSSRLRGDQRQQVEDDGGAGAGRRRRVEGVREARQRIGVDTDRAQRLRTRPSEHQLRTRVLEDPFVLILVVGGVGRDQLDVPAERAGGGPQRADRVRRHGDREPDAAVVVAVEADAHGAGPARRAERRSCGAPVTDPTRSEARSRRRARTDRSARA